MQVQYVETDFYLPDEACYWISDREEIDSVLNMPIRVHYIAVRRGGNPAIYREAIGLSSQLGIRGFPPVLYMAGETSVASALEQVESIKSEKIPTPPPLQINSDGESFVDAEHPALEAIPDARDYTRTLY